MKKILVPIDFSVQAEYAAKVAVSIAKLTNAKIYLLHMLELPTGVIDPSSYGTSSNTPTALLFLKRAYEKFEKFKKLSFFDGIKIEDSVLFHKAYDGIIDESVKNDIDLIVMGSKGTSGLEEMLVGSNTEKVVRNSDIPVLVIKQEIENFKIENIVFASNFNSDARKSFQKILDFSAIFDAQIHLLKINTIHNFETTKESSDAIRNFINDFDLNNYTLNIYNDVSVEAGVLNFAKVIDADIILLNTHGRRGLAHLFTGSIGEDLANHAKLPVLTFKI
ncbi:Nucleotide-binding universal stress protein, UspA family [Lutibacter agarilyticus]|uniref:Nucleotide-binding universal stress protein, UspA family n=1 Tax=Lutibacter agarilyticus TaxID=1109740 RepID=A0A238X8G0_9FLAO|nr:universal stress protein [Lutibacter agarilyticus]SNR54851.1 Nucleotide-binding universal stress protein, UspA family [Lutibacter agarilyticus]